MDAATREQMGLHKPYGLVRRWIKALRASSGLSQAEISIPREVVDWQPDRYPSPPPEIPYGTWCGWEMGRRLPDLPYAMELQWWECELLKRGRPMDMSASPFVKALTASMTEEEALYVLSRYAAAVHEILGLQGSGAVLEDAIASVA